MELIKRIQHYSSGEIRYICLIDENGKWQGEYIGYDTDGSISLKGFLKNDWWIGKYYSRGNYCFSSFVEYRKNISEHEYKKELAMVRLGLIEMPELSYLLKDYDENGKIK
jgi:antitoxin component YwqK of YwqJK toxin-antitoxin module